MQFINPAFLWGLLILAIPIIIHLFHFRRYKRVFFTNVKFLKELKDEKNANRKLRNLLVLLMRLLAIAALIFAFAQPYFANKKKNLERKLVSVFIDNSFSMNALSKDVPLIDKAKQRAGQIISAYSETDRFQLLSHDFSGVSSKILTREEALHQIDQIEITPEVKDLGVIEDRMIQSFTGMQGDKSFYLLSDFQENINNLSATKDSSFQMFLIPFQAVQESNISIDTAFFINPTPLLNQVNPLLLTVTNHSDADQDNIRVNIEQNGQVKPAGNFDIPARQSVTDTIAVNFANNADQRLLLKIEDYPVQFDDNYYLSAPLDKSAEVLNIYSGATNRYLNALFAGTSELSLSQENSSNVKYDKFKNYNLIILDDIDNLSTGLISGLVSYVNNGGNVLVFPSKNANKDGYNDLFTQLKANALQQWEDTKREVIKVNVEEFVFNKVFARLSKNISLPISSGNFTFSNFASNGGESLLDYRDGSPYMQKYSRGEGQLFICASSLDRKINPLVENAEIFVPMMYKMSLSKGTKAPATFTIGKSNALRIKNPSSQSDILFEVKGEQTFIPQQINEGNYSMLQFSDEITQAGFYSIINADQIVRDISFNYDRRESDLRYTSKNELSKKYEDIYTVIDEEKESNLASFIQEKEQGIFLWRLFLILALVFLAIESLILRFWKT